MKYIFTLLSLVIFISCAKNDKKNKLTKTKEDLILDFCKIDVKNTCISPSTIKYDSTLTNISIIPGNHPYYKKELNEVYESYGSKQIDDTISNKWSVSLYFDSENKYGANIRNNIIYIIKENTEYRHDTIFNEPFIILMKRDQNKIHEYLGME